VLLATSPHLPRWARRVPPPTTPAPAPHNGQHTTRPQPHKQLLVGWIVGGMAATMTGSSKKGGRRRTMPHHPPPASRATARGVGRGWNTRDEGTTGKDGEGRRRRRQQAGRKTMTHHPPPAPRATARGVDRGWNDEDNNVSNTIPLANARPAVARGVFFF
jgi:hypothetical protein